MSAALELIDAGGYSACSMRRLARELGVAPNALYSYVRDKDDLLQGVVEHALGGLAPAPEQAGPLEARMLDVCSEFRRGMLQHPNLVLAPGFRESFALANLSLGRSLSDLLMEAGFVGHGLIRATYTVFYHAIGFVLLEAAREHTGLRRRGPEVLLAWGESHLDAEEGDTLRAVAEDVVEIDMDELFAHSLAVLLRGLLPAPDGAAPSSAS